MTEDQNDDDDDDGDDDNDNGNDDDTDPFYQDQRTEFSKEEWKKFFGPF